jgi:predicted transport protein
MQAVDISFLQLLEGQKQFLVPIFQRDYSWGIGHCAQLWNDILRIGAEEGTRKHFVGSIVYIAAEENDAAIGRWLVIDGQQRLTTMTLLLAALRDTLPEEGDAIVTSPQIDDTYLRNPYGKGELRHKLQLRRADQDALGALLGKKELSAHASERITENYDFFVTQISDADPSIVFRGIQKLVAVSVSLVRGHDDPQMIFESLNSTGLGLASADLIRNFVLMRQEEKVQTQLYEDQWRPIEVAFGTRYRADFDKFVLYYLTLELEPSKQLRTAETYESFRNYFHQVGGEAHAAEILARLRRFSSYYVSFMLGQETNPELHTVFQRLRSLVEVATPVIMRLYDCYQSANTLTHAEFIEAVSLMESYIFRRSVLDLETRSLGRIFATLAFELDNEHPLESLKVALFRQSKKRRFPADMEFQTALETRNIYEMRICKYLLDRIQNESKEKVNTETLSIEHVLPQNDELNSEWRAMLGGKWRAIQEEWLHRLGNLTLTGYNSEYGDKPFDEKKTMSGGFNDSPLRLNKFIREQKQWTAAEIEKRGSDLAGQALSIWRPLIVAPASVRAAELKEFKATAASRSIADVEFHPEAQALFELLRPSVQSLSPEVIEICRPKSITYRVYDFFVEVIPRKRRLDLMLNIDFEDCDDPSQTAQDKTDWEFIVNAAENGGTLFSLRHEDQIPAALHLIKQAYQRVTE